MTRNQLRAEMKRGDLKGKEARVSIIEDCCPVCGDRFAPNDKNDYMVARTISYHYWYHLLEELAQHQSAQATTSEQGESNAR